MSSPLQSRDPRLPPNERQNIRNWRYLGCLRARTYCTSEVAIQIRCIHLCTIPSPLQNSGWRRTQGCSRDLNVNVSHWTNRSQRVAWIPHDHGSLLEKAIYRNHQRDGRQGTSIHTKNQDSTEPTISPSEPLESKENTKSQTTKLYCPDSVVRSVWSAGCWVGSWSYTRMLPPVSGLSSLKSSPENVDSTKPPVLVHIFMQWV